MEPVPGSAVGRARTAASRGSQVKVSGSLSGSEKEAGERAKGVLAGMVRLGPALRIGVLLVVPVLVEQFQDQPIVGLNLHVADATGDEAAVLVLSAGTSLRECSS